MRISEGQLRQGWDGLDIHRGREGTGQRILSNALPGRKEKGKMQRVGVTEEDEDGGIWSALVSPEGSGRKKRKQERKFLSFFHLQVSNLFACFFENDISGSAVYNGPLLLARKELDFKKNISLPFNVTDSKFGWSCFSLPTLSTSLSNLQQPYQLTVITYKIQTWHP